MPQGAPESPAMYACLMEELLKIASATLEANDVPAGVAVHACNFADDTCLFVSGCRQLSYTTIVGETLSGAHQFLAPGNTDILAWAASESIARVWGHSELESFVRDGITPPTRWTWRPPCLSRTRPRLQFRIGLGALGRHTWVFVHNCRSIRNPSVCGWPYWSLPYRLPFCWGSSRYG